LRELDVAVVNLTEKRIRDLAFGSGIHRDEQVRGLMVICHKSTKTYAVQGDVRRNGRHIRTVRVKIDRVDRIGLNEARRRAKGLMSQIQGGVESWSPLISATWNFSPGCSSTPKSQSNWLSIVLSGGTTMKNSVLLGRRATKSVSPSDMISVTGFE